MKFDSKIFSLPPYISTTWDQIASLQILPCEEGYPTLVISMKNGEKIQVPNLNPTLVDGIFALHAKILGQAEEAPEEKSPKKEKTPSASINLPPPSDWRATSSFALMREAFNPFEVAMQFGIELPTTPRNSILEHDPAMSNAPSLPREILRKLTAIARTLNLGSEIELPNIELECNCIHCQIGKAIQLGLHQNEHLDEDVELEDLKFSDWDVSKNSDGSYLVAHKIDKENFVVLLDPVCCSCAHANCPHLKAVLESYI